VGKGKSWYDSYVHHVNEKSFSSSKKETTFDEKD
jgi:hypothetical protein